MSENANALEKPSLVAEVFLDNRLDKALDYSLPFDLVHKVAIGTRVEIPFRQTITRGTIVAIKEKSALALRPIHSILQNESLSEPMWKLSHWMSRYYCCSLQKVLRSMMPPKSVQKKIPLRLQFAVSKETALSYCSNLNEKAKGQREVLEKMLPLSRLPLFSEISRYGLSSSSVHTLIKKKILALFPDADDSLEESDFFSTPQKTLGEEQQKALDSITASLSENRFAVHLVYGVTGSGKTEIYLQAIQETLNRGKSAIVLVPEIALTTQTIERFRARFGVRIAIFHHRRSDSLRMQDWERMKNGEIAIAIGARSAIFCPAHKLGLIVVDEEQDNSYKQTSEAPTYHARDVAIMRAKLENVPIILGSATPAIESYTHATLGKYQLSTLTSRAMNASLPQIRIIDMKTAFDRFGGFTHFSSELLDAIKIRMERGEQTLLLLNRRGFHRMQICQNCQHIIKCPHCDITLTFHKENEELRCHLCNFLIPPHSECPQCHTMTSMQFRGFGTEHVERSLHAIFPKVRTLRMDRDTTQKKESHEEILLQFRSHKADVLIGTQMIAKGLHFPAVTLVGVLNADTSLSIPDFRSAENVFQLLTQVAGRAGRAELNGEVILQTSLPSHPILQMALEQNYVAFYKQEVSERKMFSFPPFCRLIKLVFSGKNEKETYFLANQFRKNCIALSPKEALFLPTLPSGHPKIKDRFRFQFIIKTSNILCLSERISQYRAAEPLPRSVSLLIDVDPVSTFF